jgi:hypothetical protein
MTTLLRNDRDIILIPREWWPDKAGGPGMVVHRHGTSKIPCVQLMRKPERR